MSDEEHHFESNIRPRLELPRPNLSRPCHFVGIDIFTAKKLEDIVPSPHNCYVLRVSRTYYQLIDISEDGFVSRYCKTNLKLIELLLKSVIGRVDEEHHFESNIRPTLELPRPNLSRLDGCFGNGVGAEERKRRRWRGNGVVVGRSEEMEERIEMAYLKETSEGNMRRRSEEMEERIEVADLKET
nr:eukaryotic translation initiation factor 5A-2 [Ipomoea batatas]